MRYLATALFLYSLAFFSEVVNLDFLHVSRTFFVLHISLSIYTFGSIDQSASYVIFLSCDPLNGCDGI